LVLAFGQCSQKEKQKFDKYKAGIAPTNFYLKFIPFAISTFSMIGKHEMEIQSFLVKCVGDERRSIHFANPRFGNDAIYCDSSSTSYFVYLMLRFWRWRA
jgi:hypothetical protein